MNKLLTAVIASILLSAQAGALTTPPRKPGPVNCDTTPVGCRYPGHGINPRALPPVLVPFSVPPASAPWVGNTDATIQAQFPAVFLYAVQTNTALDQTFSQWAPEQWAIMSVEYNRNYGNLSLLMQAFARKLSAPNLLKLARAFGPDRVTAAVSVYSPAAVRAAYFAAVPAITPTPRSHWQIRIKGLSDWIPPTLKMTQTDLFYEAFAVKGATVESALVSVALRNVVAVQASYEVGYKIGGVIVLVLDQVDPNINITLGNWIGATVDFAVSGYTQMSNPSSSPRAYVGDPETGGWWDSNGNYSAEIPDAGTWWDWYSVYGQPYP